MTTCLDTDTEFNYLNYYYQTMLDETNYESHVYKFECLYEWWQPDDYDYDEWS